jgi:hypothetical protein
MHVTTTETRRNNEAPGAVVRDRRAENHLERPFPTDGIYVIDDEDSIVPASR